MNAQNKNLLVRIISSAILLPVCIFLVAKGGLWSAALFGLAAAVCAGEYFAITLGGLSFVAGCGIALAGAMPLFPLWFSLHSPPHALTAQTGEACFWVCAAFLVFTWVYHLFQTPLPDAPSRAAHLLWGVVYAGAGLTALSLLRGAPWGTQWILSVAWVTWANDTLAYFGGRLLGRHKLFARVSPNKTWEGFLSGLLGSLASLFIYRAVCATPLRAADCWILGILGGFFGPLGDLCESMLKRAHGVKDSGKLIPGHGGLLDRLDALLFNAPLVFAYVHWIRGFV